MSWIRDGKNADAEFDRLYMEEPTSAGEPSDDVVRVTLEERASKIGMGVLIVLLALVVLVLFVLRPNHSNHGG